jgi:hypothetical protein
MTRAELHRLVDKLPEAIVNSVTIRESMNVVISAFLEPRLPIAPAGAGGILAGMSRARVAVLQVVSD